MVRDADFGTPRPIPDEDYGGEGYWVGSRRYEGRADTNAQFVMDHRSEAVLWGVITDDDAFYSYDDWALIEIGERFFLINTSGCSCPLPTETWGVACEPGDLASQWQHLTGGTYRGWGVPSRQMEDFVVLFQAVAKHKNWPDPTQEVPA